MEKENELFEKINLTSLYYKIISLGFDIFKSDNDANFLIVRNSCSSCKENWSFGIKECLFCGTQNYHIYTCTKCGYQSSITVSKKKCQNPKCFAENSLIQFCQNSKCLSNVNEDVREIIINNFGIFGKNKTGFSVRQNSCKKCGNIKNCYISFEINVVSKEEDLENDTQLFLLREALDKPIKLYKTTVNEFENIEDFLNYKLNTFITE